MRRGKFLSPSMLIECNLVFTQQTHSPPVFFFTGWHLGNMRFFLLNVWNKKTTVNSIGKSFVWLGKRVFLLRGVARMLGGDYKEKYLKCAKCQIKSTQTLFIKKLFFFLKRSAVFLSVISEIQAQHPGVDLKTFECCWVSCRRRWGDSNKSRFLKKIVKYAHQCNNCQINITYSSVTIKKICFL